VPARPAPPPVRPKPPKAKPAAPKEEPPKPRAKVRPTPIRPKNFLWAFPAEPPFEDEAIAMTSAPAVDALGRVLVFTQGRLYALAEEENRPRVVWDYVVGSHVPGRIVVGLDGNIRLHSGDGLLHCISPEGKQVFSPAKVGEPLGWAAPVVDRDGNTYLSAYDGGLLRVGPDGKPGPRRYLRSRRKFDSAAVLAGGVLYVGSEDPYFFAVELGADSGRLLWNLAAEQGLTGGFVNSSPARTADGLLVVAARDEKLLGFTPAGSLAFSTAIPGQMLGSPVIDRHGHIYVGVSQTPRGQPGRGMLVCVDGNSHKIRWQYATGAPVESTPAIGDDDVIYFGDNSGTIHAVDGRGAAVWTAQVEAAVRSAGTILAPNRLAFGLDDDVLVVLECSSTGLAAEGWPKIARTLGQSGIAD
jgi:outer membrane protein assembly factor BamB